MTTLQAPAIPAPTTRAAAVAGGRAMIPLLLAVTPQGLTLGLALGQLPVDHLAAWSSSWLMYSGSAQLALVSTYATGSAGLTAALVALVINLRLLFYSAAIAPHWRDRSVRWRLLAGYLLIDPSLALAQDRYTKPGSARARAAFYLGGAALLWVWWQAITAAGMLLPSVVPHADALSAAAPLCFVALLANAARSLSTVTAATTAAVAAAALAALPWSTGLVVAMAVGTVAGALAGRNRRGTR
jgi:predicted branched-subunit amino acid permease